MISTRTSVSHFSFTLMTPTSGAYYLVSVPAESWELSTDLSQIKLNLRRGVQFHTGREFTSDDVKWNMEWVRNPKIASGALVGQSNWFTTIETPDKNTIILTSEKPRPGVFDFLNYLRIQDKDVRDGPDGATKVGGTGPFKWVEWIPGTSISMVKKEAAEEYEPTAV